MSAEVKRFLVWTDQDPSWETPVVNVRLYSGQTDTAKGSVVLF